MGKHKHFFATHLFSNYMPFIEANNFSCSNEHLRRKTGYKSLLPSLFLVHTVICFLSLPFPFQISLLLYEKLVINHSYIFSIPQPIYKCHLRSRAFASEWLLARNTMPKSLLRASLFLFVFYICYLFFAPFSANKFQEYV